jgi:soluble lytic murein transglycosylase-like protein
MKKKSGCGSIVFSILGIAVMVWVIINFSPKDVHSLSHNQSSTQQNLIQQIQQFFTHTSAPTTKQHSVKLPTPSGSCFDLARTAAIQNGIDPTLYARQINQESGCQSSVCSSAGACGVAQLMPEMARSLGVNPMNVSQSLSAGAHLMAGYLKAHNGSWSVALACYNAGSGAVQTALSYGASWLAHLPLETQNYIASILGNGGQA